MRLKEKESLPEGLRYIFAVVAFLIARDKRLLAQLDCFLRQRMYADKGGSGRVYILERRGSPDCEEFVDYALALYQ